MYQRDILHSLRDRSKVDVRFPEIPLNPLRWEGKSSFQVCVDIITHCIPPYNCMHSAEIALYHGSRMWFSRPTWLGFHLCPQNWFSSPSPQIASINVAYLFSHHDLRVLTHTDSTPWTWHVRLLGIQTVAEFDPSNKPSFSRGIGFCLTW